MLDKCLTMTCFDYFVSDTLIKALVESKKILEIFITFTTNLSEVDTFVVKDLDTVSSIIWDENLLAIIDNDPVRELQMLGATEFVENIASLKQKKVKSCPKNAIKNQITWSKMITRITLHSTTMMRPLLSTVTPRGCCKMLAPNLRTNWPYWL